MRLTDLTFLATFATCLVMVGVIWVIQLVHYPLFSQVGSDGFPGYHADHGRLISYIVMPVMLVELATAVWLVVSRPVYVPAWAAYAGLGLVGLAWLVTAFLSVPAHSARSTGFQDAAHRSLVLTNWLRTISWSARAALLGWVALQALKLTENS